MKSKILLQERGQALVLIALAAIVLFGFTALAIDGSAKFSDRRHAQNAADTAALAGSLALVNDDTNWKVDAFQRADDNGYTGDLVNNQVWVFKCSDDLLDRDDAPVDCGPYEGDSNYVAVVILSHVNTTFARVIGVSQTHNLVSSVTYWNKRGPLYDGNLIVALNPNPCTGNGANGNIALGTSGGSHSDAQITLTGGGAFINSGGTGCGLEVMGCPSITVSSGTLSSVGDGNINLDVGSQACQDKIIAPTPSYEQDAYKFTPDMPKVPDICSPQTQPGAPNTTTLNQGYYSTFPPAKDATNHNMSNNITLSAGIYCLDTDLSLTNGKSITGNNVLIYLKPGRKISINGGTLTLTGRTSGDYQGYVIIVDSNFSGQVPDCIVNGAATVSFTGTVFAPYCDVQIDGGGHTTSLTAQLIGYTVKVTGSQTVNLTYDQSLSAKSEPKIGLMR